MTFSLCLGYAHALQVRTLRRVNMVQRSCKPTGCMQWFKAYVLGCKDFGSGLAVLVSKNVSRDICKLCALQYAYFFRNVQICLAKLFPNYLHIEIPTQVQNDIGNNIEKFLATKKVI